MKKLMLLGFLATTSAFAGDKSSGGGDPLRFDFAEGKTQAIFILDNLSEESFDSTTSPEVRKYLLEYRGKLSADLAKSPLDWNAPESQATCAHTEFRQNAKVELSFSKCRARIYSKEDAGKVLIHEASHHWGVEDETFADDVALAAYQAWENKKLSAIPFCQGQEMVADALPGLWQVNNAISRHLPGGVPTKFENIRITNDPKVIEKIGGIGRCAFLAGILSVEKNGKVTWGPFPYVLTEFQGQLVLMSFKARGDGTYSSETNRITFLTERAQKPKAILLVGGDHDDEAVTAYEKVP